MMAAAATAATTSYAATIMHQWFGQETNEKILNRNQIASKKLKPAQDSSW